MYRTGGYPYLFFCHMKPMLLLVSQRFFASNLQHRSKQEVWTGRSSVTAWRWGGLDRTKESYPQAISFFLLLAARDASSSVFRRTKSRHSTAWAIVTPSCYRRRQRRRGSLSPSGNESTYQQSSYVNNPKQSDELWWWLNIHQFPKQNINSSSWFCKTKVLNWAN